MKTLTRKLSRTAITLVLVILAFIAIFRFGCITPNLLWTRDARFSADVVAIAPDVAGLITHVNVHDNQLVKKDQVLFTIDQPRYQKALAEAEADVAYYQVWRRKNARKPVAVIASAYRRCPGKRSIRRTMSCRLYCINWLKPGRRAIWLNSIWSAPSFARLPTAG